MVFTRGTKRYAEQIIDLIDKKKLIVDIYSRKHLEKQDGLFLKNLKKINQDLRKVMIVDNNKTYVQ